MSAFLEAALFDVDVLDALDAIHLAVLDPDNPVRGFEHLVVVGGSDHGHTQLAAEMAQQLDDFFAGIQIEIGRWFVGQNNGGRVDQGAGDGDALLLAAGEFTGPVVEPVLEANAFKHLARAFLSFGRRGAGQQGR